MRSNRVHVIFQGWMILKAEDNDLNSFILSQILEEWDCTVDIVQNGEEAVKTVIRNDYQLIMMDTHMPIMSGFEAIKEIRGLDDPVRRQVPIITISASIIEEEYSYALQVGANDFISKPFDPVILHKKIKDNIMSE